MVGKQQDCKTKEQTIKLLRERERDLLHPIFGKNYHYYSGWWRKIRDGEVVKVKMA